MKNCIDFPWTFIGRAGLTAEMSPIRKTRRNEARTAVEVTGRTALSESPTDTSVRSNLREAVMQSEDRRRAGVNTAFTTSLSCILGWSKAERDSYLSTILSYWKNWGKSSIGSGESNNTPPTFAHQMVHGCVLQFWFYTSPQS